MSYETRTVKLSEVVDLISGGTPKTSIKEYWDGNIDWLSIADFNNGNRYVSGASKKITELGLINSPTNLLHEKDVIISARGTVGVIAQLKKSMAFNQSCYGVRGKKDIADTSYIYYVLKNTVKRLKEVSHGAVFDTITKNTFDLITIDLPNLEIQNKTVSVLGALDDKIELLQQTNKTLELIAQAIFKSWFVDFDPVHAKQQGKECAGIDKATADLFPNDFVESELGLIPKSWTVVKIESIAKLVTRGITPKYEDKSGRLIINQKVNRGSKLDFNLSKDLSKTLEVPIEKYAKKWDILINCLGEGTLGRVHLYKRIDNIYPVDQHITICRLESAKAFLLYQILASTAGQQRIDSLITGSTGMTMLNISKIRDFDFLFPNEKILEKYSDLVEPIFHKIGDNEMEIETLSNIRDTLLPRLMSGKLDISNIKEQLKGVA
ncbi:hypothetical protein G6705_06115 [Polynucleobacter paneuropaeus]|nr:hypothetical protein [Polynucleobacter paneuropaeus]